MTSTNRRLAALALALFASTTVTVIGCGEAPPPNTPVTEDAKKEAETIIQKEYGPTQVKSKSKK